MRFYLGTDNPRWLWLPDFEGIPLFLSHNRLRGRVSPYPRAVAPYAVDSGAYTHLTKHGKWTETPEDYVASLRRYAAELGPFDFAGQQDSLTQPAVLDKIEAVTGSRPTVRDLQAATVQNLLDLRTLAPDLPIVPTLQGAHVEDYIAMIGMFADAGVDLTAEPVVGVGSLVGKSPGFVDRLVTLLDHHGIRNVHAFGIKGRQIKAARERVASIDTQAWSFIGRKRPFTDCTHASESCAHCPRFALAWRDEMLALIEVAGDDAQLGFAI